MLSWCFFIVVTLWRLHFVCYEIHGIFFIAQRKFMWCFVFIITTLTSWFACLCFVSVFVWMFSAHREISLLVKVPLNCRRSKYFHSKTHTHTYLQCVYIVNMAAKEILNGKLVIQADLRAYHFQTIHINLKTTKTRISVSLIGIYY